MEFKWDNSISIKYGFMCNLVFNVVHKESWLFWLTRAHQRGLIGTPELSLLRSVFMFLAIYPTAKGNVFRVYVCFWVPLAVDVASNFHKMKSQNVIKSNIGIYGGFMKPFLIYDEKGKMKMSKTDWFRLKKNWVHTSWIGRFTWINLVASSKLKGIRE